MKNENKQLQARYSLVRGFCRTAIWIDDELDKIGTDKLNPFFLETHRTFSKEGILCHLQEFNLTDPIANDHYGDSNDVDRIMELVKSADITLIDWHLNAIESPQSTVDIIKHIISAGGLRFIFIVTKHPDASTEFLREFRDTFKPHVKDFYHTGEGQFLTILTKPSYDDSKLGDKIVESIREVLISAYSDYLHWAGIELVVKIRAIIPKLLSRLSTETDLAILSCHQNQESPGQLQGMLVRSLLDDLRVLTESEPFQVLSTIDHHADEWNDASAFCKEIKAAKGRIAATVVKQDKEQAKIIALKELDRIFDHSKDRIKEFEGIEEALKALSTFNESGSLNFFKSSSKAFARFCETVTVLETETNRISPGTVVEFKENSKVKYAVCISPACDCVRKPRLLFSVGDKPSAKKPLRATRHDVEKFDISFDASNLILLDINREPSKSAIKDGKVIGVLRERFALRLINRIWAHLTRVGVDSAHAMDLVRPEADYTDSNEY